VEMKQHLAKDGVTHASAIHDSNEPRDRT
jgi:hypothetical protein